MGQWFGVDDVYEAQDRIAAHIRKTPLEESVYLNTDDQRVFFKLESVQAGKSFKIRGALNAMMQLSEAERKRGVGTVSTGNHGVAVALAAHELGIRNCSVILPVDTPQIKRDRIRFYGARSMLLGADYDETLTLGMNFIDCAEMTYIDSDNLDPRLYAGNGTVALEILQENPNIDTIVVPVGGGTLACGVAVAAKGIRPDVRIIGVQTEACPAMACAIRDKVCYRQFPTQGPTVCSATVGGIGQITFEMLPDLLDDLILVSERSIRSAFALMTFKEQCPLEASSAMVVAAMRDYPGRVGGSNVALVISGGNVDVNVMRTVLDEGEGLE